MAYDPYAPTSDAQIPGMDPTWMPAGLPATDTAPPAGPMPEGLSGGLPDTGGGGPDVRSILHYALPLIAAAFAAKSGGFAGVGPGYLHGVQVKASLDNAKQAREYRQQQLALSEEARQIARVREARAQAENEAQAAQAKTAAEDAAIRKALDGAAQNPDFIGKVNKAGPENFAITVPGIGNINLKDAFDRIGVIQGPEGYAYGKPPAPPKPPSLITGTDAQGRSTRVYDRPGVHPYEKPAKPEKPAKLTRRAFNWTDNDPSSDSFGQTFRVIEDENGNEISRRRLTGSGSPLTDSPRPAAAPNDPLGIRGK